MWFCTNWTGACSDLTWEHAGGREGPGRTEATAVAAAAARLLCLGFPQPSNRVCIHTYQYLPVNTFTTFG